MSLQIGWSNFALTRHTPQTGHSFSTLSHDEVVTLVCDNWDKRTPGTGETDLNRKVLVPVPPQHFMCPPRMPLQEGMPVKARVVTRQEGEDPFVETYISLKDAEAMGFKGTPAKSCQIVCYSANALEENDGERSTDCDWEIVCILANPSEAMEPMPPLTLARNYLEKDGGTFTDYTAREFAESIYYYSTQNGIKVLMD